MLLHPRSSPRSGFSRPPLLLALAGLGALAVLAFLFTRGFESRAAEARGRGGVRALPAEPAPKEAPRPKVDLVPVQRLDGGPSAAAPAPAAAAAAPTLAAGAAAPPQPLVASETKVEGPKLKRLKGEEGDVKGEPVEPGAMRAEYKDQRRLQQEKALAEGRVPPATAPKGKQAAPKTPNPNAQRLEHSTKGKKGSKPKPPPKGG